MILVSHSLSLQGEQIDRRCREQLELRIQELLVPRAPVRLREEGPPVSHEPSLLRGVHLFVLQAAGADLLPCSGRIRSHIRHLSRPFLQVYEQIRAASPGLCNRLRAWRLVG